MGPKRLPVPNPCLDTSPVGNPRARGTVSRRPTWHACIAIHPAFIDHLLISQFVLYYPSSSIIPSLILFLFLIDYLAVQKILALENEIVQIGFENEDVNVSPEYELTMACQVIGYNFQLVDETDDDDPFGDFDDEESDDEVDLEIATRDILRFIGLLNICNGRI